MRRRNVCAQAICAVTLLFGIREANCQASPENFYDQSISAAQSVEAIGTDLFGDATQLRSGQTEFAVADVELPGSNTLSVAVKRRYEVGKRLHLKSDLMFGDWDLDIPFLYGTYAGPNGWQVSTAQPDNRCSPSSKEQARPPTRQGLGGSIFPAEGFDGYWRGNRIHLPGGDHDLLYANADTPRPSALDVKWTTRKSWVFSCLASLQSGGVGEGFLAVGPDGTKYQFDWMVKFPMRGFWGSYQGSSAELLGRDEIRIYPTLVEDRFGNWVRYTYQAAGSHRVTSIASSDGRQLVFTYGDTEGRVTSITDNQRTWTYLYTGTRDAATSELKKVILPDNSAWLYTMPGSINFPTMPQADFNLCNPGPVLVPNPRTAIITHPSGATGTFTFQRVRHGRTYVPGSCSAPNAYVSAQLAEGYVDYAKTYDVASLVQKQITGPGIGTHLWTIQYSPNWVDNGNPTTLTTVTAPDGSVTTHTHGTQFNVSDGQLLRTDLVQGGVLRRREDFGYVTDTTGQPFPSKVGSSVLQFFDPLHSESQRPRRSTTLTQDEVTYTNVVDSFDSFARPTRETGSNSARHSRTDVTTYYDDLAKWVLGQVASVSNENSGIEINRTDYWPDSALPRSTWEFGKLLNTFEYAADGTVASVSDARDTPSFDTSTRYYSWKRGIPQLIQFPATSEYGQTTMSAVVNDVGWVTSITDEAGNTTLYDHDPMGRVSNVTYPLGDSTAWTPSTFTLEQVQVPEYGLPPGHWKQTRTDGNKRATTYFDAFLRPVVAEEFDATSPASTLIQSVTRYNTSGLASFQSYPQRGISTFDQSSLKGTTTEYDPLGRVKTSRADSELGPLETRHEYLPNLQMRITNPRQHSVTTTYVAWGEPSTEFPVSMIQPEGIYTDIERDILGKPTALTRRNADGSVGLVRRYVYGSNQELCNVIEPEVGTTVTAYDAGGNVLWSASGQNPPAPGGCDYGRINEASKITRTHDSRGRISTLTFPDGLGSAAYSYTSDGKVRQLQATNGANGLVTTSYTYNKRRMLVSESTQLAGVFNWSIGYGYTGEGNLASNTYPGGLLVEYAPNALGQATRAGSFASGATYYPNGSLASFTYGNGIVHSLTQNDRLLADRSQDSYGGSSVLDDGYDYDANGNVAAISDGLAGGRGNRNMAYDGMDRLSSSSSPMFGTAAYSYDVLDNLRTVTAPGRNHVYYYDSSWRLTNVQNGVNGPTAIGLGYDARGNLLNKNGQAYVFDIGNRLRESVGKETYAYDGNGRRVMAVSPSKGTILSLYGQDGMLRYQEDNRRNERSIYVYLGGSLVASASDAISSSSAPTYAPILSAPATNTSGSYLVGWTAVLNATSYRLEMSVNAGPWSIAQETASLSMQTSSQSTATYTYRVSACNAGGCGPASANSSIGVTRSITQSPVLTVPSQSYTGSYSVTWGSVLDATSYLLEESANGGGWTAVQNGAAITATFSGRATGIYAYRVTACGPLNCGPVSVAASITVTLPPQTPTLSTPGVSTTGAYVVNWSGSTGATTYRLEELISGGSWNTIQNSAATSLPLTGKINGTYQYRVVACNVAGCSAFSAVATTVVAQPPPSTPTGLLLEEERDEVGFVCTISWNASTGATSYQLQKATTVIYNGPLTQTPRSGRCGTGYSVKACNAYGCSSWSGVVP